MKPDCNVPGDYSAWVLETEETEDDPETSIAGFGVGDAVPEVALFLKDAEAASCHTRLELTTKKMECTNTFCETGRYIRQTKNGARYSPQKKNKVLKHVRKALELLQSEPTRRNDGRYLGPPAESERKCFETPGASTVDPRLYCMRTQSGTWLGFRWYRFVDQPELNQVFASIEDPAARDAARCFMQARIERLHAAQNGEGDVPRWFDAPQGADALPKKKVRIDPALLVAPPEGLEAGFVPVPVFERNREAPPGCEVFVGDVAEEPDPLLEGYYEGYANEGREHEVEVCPANPESKGKKYTYPGTIFSYSLALEQSTRTGHKVPLRSELELDDAVTCGLVSDPPKNFVCGRVRDWVKYFGKCSYVSHFFPYIIVLYCSYNMF